LVKPLGLPLDAPDVVVGANGYGCLHRPAPVLAFQIQALVIGYRTEWNGLDHASDCCRDSRKTGDGPARVENDIKLG
jgi:hypothetical protein